MKYLIINNGIGTKKIINLEMSSTIRTSFIVDRDGQIASYTIEIKIPYSSVETANETKEVLYFRDLSFRDTIMDTIIETLGKQEFILSIECETNK